MSFDLWRGKGKFSPNNGKQIVSARDCLTSLEWPDTGLMIDAVISLLPPS